MKSLQLLEKLKSVQSAKVQYRKLIRLYKDERSHRVSTDDYDCHSADTEENDKLKRQQSYNFKKEDKI
jgi:hypothetical protein